MTWEIRDSGHGACLRFASRFLAWTTGALMRTGMGACPCDSSIR